MDFGTLKKTALIGHTGFVGLNLLRQASFSHTYNSTNFTEMSGEAFDLVVCAGLSAAKWLANKDPETDRAQIQKLRDVLSTVSCEHFILISTIDVYKKPIGVTELDIPTAEGHHAYGAHRFAFEEFVNKRFSSRLILRLPALFGPGLKKNALFDLMNDNNVEQINGAGRFQWYPVTRLWQDIEQASMQKLELLNMASEPTLMSTIAERYFPAIKLTTQPGPAPTYDMWSVHSEKFGGSGHYLLDENTILESIASFVAPKSHAII